MKYFNYAKNIWTVLERKKIKFVIICLTADTINLYAAEIKESEAQMKS